MGDTVIMQYVGFAVEPLARVYKFLVREAANAPREFTVTIGNDAFNSRRARFQDAPDICSLKLHHELSVSANHPSTSHFRVSDTELEVYFSAHAKKSQRNPYTHKLLQDH